MDWEMRFADASGYICQCQPGFAGENCSVNINECESEPCQNGGVCLDQVNSYICACSAGFLGLQCEVNINECESQPCLNGGWCEDGRASYTCHCPDPEPGELPWGGQLCHIRLHGCVQHQCQNEAICSPWLRGDEHGHTCLCQHGFYDEHCSTRTTFSFSTPGLIHLEVPLLERERREVNHLSHYGFGVQLRFRTTLPNMLLFFRGDEENHLFLEIVNGGLYAKALSEDADLDVTFSGLVSDGDWRDAHVILDDQGLVLIVKGPGCDRDGCKVIDDGADEPHFEPASVFSHVYVGGVLNKLLDTTVSKTPFIGCMEDLMIDSKAILPQNLPDDQAVELGCSKTLWCEPDPCSAHGQCVDMWTSYYCDCHRPFYGDSCSEGNATNHLD
uniref:CRUMBS n=1 Tax=Knipowitschia caucasica TaxID=637954 RepID=A0AAV2IWP0_KNICA